MLTHLAPIPCCLPGVECWENYLKQGIDLLDLTSDRPYWLLKNGLVQSVPYLDEDRTCDVVIVGAGVTSAIITYQLSKLGLSILVLDKRDLAQGSTSASTALLQYEIDLPLVEMAEKIGLESAEQAYRISHDSIDSLERIIHESNVSCEFSRKTSIFLAQDRRSAKMLAEEARARKRIQLDVNYHDQASVRECFGLDGVAALSSTQAASCDPYQLAHGLMRVCQGNGVEYFDRIAVAELHPKSEGVQVTTDRGPRIDAKYVVFANGFESQEWLREKVVDLDNTYALVSQPIEKLNGWDRDWMLWETKSPYLYLRITSDNRLLVGGEDDRFHNPTKRDLCMKRKAKTIEKKVKELIPSLEWEPEFIWAGTFGKTTDGLAYIGRSPEYPRCFFALGFGGNGITFSTIASQMIPEMIMGREPRGSDLFRFGRR